MTSKAPTTASTMQATTFGLDQVNVSFLEGKHTSPLVISPRWDDSVDFVATWLHLNRSWVEEQMLAYGAVYIRGFLISNPPEFERAVNALQPKLCDSYRGTSPRTLKEGCKYAFSAADAPVNFPIAQHLEMSFLKAPPRNLYFGCMKASSKPGGETSLCDFRKVYRDLSPQLRDKLATKKIKYSRRHHKIGERFTYDVGAMLGWPTLFGTSDPKEVERITQEEDGPEVQWVGKNQDCFLQEWIDEPFQQHPITGEQVWFNHSQVFHWTTFSMELWYSFKRIRDFNLIVHFIMVTLFTFIKYGLLGYKMALTTTFGDGTPITFSEMSEIRRAIHKNMVYSRWQKGDILCIDNFSTSHGRQPTYDRSRQVIVAWSHPCNKKPAAVVPREEADVDMNVVLKSGIVRVPDLVESPDSTPSTTLTNKKAQELKELFLNDSFKNQMALAGRETIQKIGNSGAVLSCS
ncbi:taurine catabolism dioxygenase TauD/TfdA family protein [Nitzschia inconspicua]|uniref:Taurine catabolism dioxygenase TauD/TfdA family protein n=1 Tax=Nitzschia inconspicua TaxID=303405 RepID=A0A9K3KYF3_9STRA|nr:taurine catabolism dioxygenase TauD/TfdA family protein [Nitzschia inconspicua]